MNPFLKSRDKEVSESRFSPIFQNVDDMVFLRPLGLIKMLTLLQASQLVSCFFFLPAGQSTSRKYQQRAAVITMVEVNYLNNQTANIVRLEPTLRLPSK